MSVAPTRDRRAERHQATRAEILAAASELIRELGVAGLSLRDLGRKVGMRPQSLYSYFDSKHAIYDALFAQGAQEFLERCQAVEPTGDPRTDLRRNARVFVDFCVEDAARYQLLLQRTIPDFEPSPEAFAPSVDALAVTRRLVEAAGGDDPAMLDLFTGLVTGLVDQQIANDPDGDRWSRLLDDALDMFFRHLDARKEGSNR
jgi:AcrR family transcriptional regulator